MGNLDCEQNQLIKKLLILNYYNEVEDLFFFSLALISLELLDLLLIYHDFGPFALATETTWILALFRKFPY